MKSINNVVSLFDGIGCGIQSLKDEGIKFKNYYASEVDPNAIKIAKTNHPEIIHVGDVRSLGILDFKNVDLLIGGSPCQNFSFAGKKKGMKTKEGHQITTLEHYLDLKDQGFEFEGESYLFWEFVRILKGVNPKYFLLENVRMKKEWSDVISEILGVEPLLINSSRVVPQFRERNYWTNITDQLPEDRSPKLSDFFPQIVTGVGFRGRGDKSLPKKSGKVGYRVTKSERNDNIANAILTSMGGLSTNGKWSGTGHYLTVDGMIKTFSSAQCELLQGLPMGYTEVEGITEGRRIHGIGNGWTVPVIRHFFRNLPTKNRSKAKNPTWEERQEFEQERTGREVKPWSHFPQGW